MKKRRIYQKKSKPMFKRKTSPVRVVINAVLVIALLLGIAFLGYSVGKPIVEFLGSRQEHSQSGGENTPLPAETAAPTVTEPPVNEPEPEETEEAPHEAEPEPEQNVGKGILNVVIPTGGGIDYLRTRVEAAKVSGYYGVSVELLASGGSVKFSSANELANSAHAIATNPLDLSEAAKLIKDAGLAPYARVSALTDHIVSWDKSVCYLFENSTSTWLDNEVSKGGKPWMSAFSEAARDYVSGLVGEITAAGFEGIIAGELEFPPFRNSDLNYVGASVKSAERYKGLVEFSNRLQTAAGENAAYAVEVDAQDIVAGRAEILRNPSLLNAKTVYVRYDSAAVGLRIVKTDETEVSYSGLSEADKLTVVMKSVNEALANSGLTVIPAVNDEALREQLVGMGYDEKLIIVY